MDRSPVGVATTGSGAPDEARPMNATLVLVPGAWLGAWAWAPVAELLHGAAVTSRCIQMPGLDDDAVGSFATHCAAVQSMIEPSAGPVVLVGHSHGGSLITEVVNRMGVTVSGVIYLDAAMPRSGESTVDTWPVDLRTALVGRVDDHGRLPPPAGEPTGVTAASRARFRPHPWEAIAHPVHRGVDRTTTAVAFVRSSPSTSSYEETRLMVDRMHGHADVIEGGHYPMLTNPAGTARALLVAAGHLLGASS